MADNKVLVIDNDLRTIKVPAGFVIGVAGDKEVTRLYFKMPRYYGGFDLGQFDISINYFNAAGEGDVSGVDDIRIGDDRINFTWLVDAYMTVYSGNVRFNVHLEKTNGSDIEKEFNTTYTVTRVLENLNTIGQVESKFPSIVEKWKTELFNRFDGRVDSTLSLSGMAADAAVTGTKLKRLEYAVSSPYNFKGSCLYSELPSGAMVNDTYYCTDKKCRYTWSGSGWYQSSINESDYQDEMTSMRKDIGKLEPGDNHIVYSRVVPNNMINKAKLEPGYYVDTSGVKQAGTGWNLTEKIDIAGLSSVHFYGGVGLTCFYNADDEFISYVNSVSGEIPIPEGASYLLASVIDSYKNTALIVRYESLYYDEGVLTIERKGYEEGFINFTVPVNQTVSGVTDADDNRSELEEYVDVNCVLSLPKNYTPFGKPVKLIMMCHGAGQGIDSWKNHEGYQALVQMFRSQGYAVFDCNGFKNDELGWSFWGNQRGVEAWRKAYKYVTDHYNVEKTFSIYGFSMGGLTAMNLAFQGFPNIDCIALSSPVLNLEACWDDESVKPVLKVLYGLGDEWDDDKVVGNNPYKHIIDINGVKHCFHKLPPIKIWYGSTEDSGAVNKQYAIDIVEAIRNSGGYAQYREVSGAGHEICYGMNHYCNVDYLVYFERFNKTEYID